MPSVRWWLAVGPARVHHACRRCGGDWQLGRRGSIILPSVRRWLAVGAGEGPSCMPSVRRWLAFGTGRIHHHAVGAEVVAMAADAGDGPSSCRQCGGGWRLSRRVLRHATATERTTHACMQRGAARRRVHHITRWMVWISPRLPPVRCPEDGPVLRGRPPG